MDIFSIYSHHIWGPTPKKSYFNWARNVYMWLWCLSSATSLMVESIFASSGTQQEFLRSASSWKEFANNAYKGVCNQLRSFHCWRMDNRRGKSALVQFFLISLRGFLHAPSHLIYASSNGKDSEKRGTKLILSKNAKTFLRSFRLRRGCAHVSRWRKCARLLL